MYKTKEEVHNRALEIVGKQMNELVEIDTESKTKNYVGDAFESWFGKSKDSASQPDLPEAGVELKATPFKKNKDGKYSAKERLVLNIINYMNVVNEDFENSHFLYKNGTIELAFYEYLKDIPRDKWMIREVALYEMSKNPVDFAIIKQDWEKINQYIKDGRAHELNEGITQYLSACTKGASSKSVREQPFSGIPAKQRAYSLKSGYMTSLLRKYIFGEESNESIIKNKFEIENSNLEEVILEKFKPYYGMKINDLKEKFEIKNSKQVNYLIAAAILNLKGKVSGSKSFEKVDEFEKANIVLKTIQFNSKGINKESISFPTFKFSELVKESWNDEDGIPSATLHNFFLETRFMFFVVRENDQGENVFEGIKFFSVPEKDIEGPIKEVWMETVDTLKQGVQLTGKEQKNGKWQIKNNFVKHSDNRVIHIRPHAKERDYTVKGKYADKLPTKAKWINKPDKSYSDEWMTKQCFWLNSDYVKKNL